MKRLKRGSTIGLFSPSTPITSLVPSRFERAKSYLEAKGYNIVEGSLTGKSDFYRSGTIDERVEELNSLIRDPNVDCIMSAIGGYNSNSLLPYIDYESFKKNPKIIIGYSDVTSLLLGIYAKTGVSTFYGPAFVASFGEFQPYVDETYKYFEDIAVKANNKYEFEVPTYWTDEYIDWAVQDRAKVRRENKWICVSEGEATGRLIGGNLNTMSCIWGSEYMPEIKKGDIILLEDCAGNAGTVERLFAFLKINGVFDRVSGILLGKHEGFNDMGTGRSPYDILREILRDVSIPIIADFDCCHTHPMMTMPIGAKIYMNAKELVVRLEEDVFED